MDWCQILVSSLSGIVGAAVGGFAAYLTMAKQFKFMAGQEIQKQKRDDELYLKRKREDLYAKMYDFLMRFEKDIRIGKDNWMSKQTKDLLNIIQVECIWGNKKTMDLFYDFLEIYLIVLYSIRKTLIRHTQKIIRKYWIFKLIFVRNWA